MSTGGWIFGPILLGFLCFAFFYTKKLSLDQRKILRLLGSLLAGLFALFLSGDILVQLGKELPQAGKLGFQAGGGLGVFVLVFLVWRPNRFSLRASAQRALKRQTAGIPIILRKPPKPLLDHLQDDFEKVDTPWELLTISLVSAVILCSCGFLPVNLPSSLSTSHSTALAACGALTTILIAITAFASPLRHTQIREENLSAGRYVSREGWLVQLAVVLGSLGALLGAAGLRALTIALNASKSYNPDLIPFAIILSVAVICITTLLMLSKFVYTLGQESILESLSTTMDEDFRRLVSEGLIGDQAKKLMPGLAKSSGCLTSDVYALLDRKNGGSTLFHVPGKGVVADFDVRGIRDVTRIVHSIGGRTGPHQMTIADNVLGLTGGAPILTVAAILGEDETKRIDHILSWALSFSHPEKPEQLGSDRLNDPLAAAVRSLDMVAFEKRLTIFEEFVDNSLAIIDDVRRKESRPTSDSPLEEIGTAFITPDLHKTLFSTIQASSEMGDYFARVLKRICFNAIEHESVKLFSHYCEYLFLWYIWSIRKRPEQADDTATSMDDRLFQLLFPLCSYTMGTQTQQASMHQAWIEDVLRPEFITRSLYLLKYAINARRGQDVVKFLERLWGQGFERSELAAVRHAHIGNGADGSCILQTRLADLTDLTVIAAAWALEVFRLRHARFGDESTALYRAVVQKAAELVATTPAFLESLVRVDEEHFEQGQDLTNRWKFTWWEDPDKEIRSGIGNSYWGGAKWPIRGALVLAAMTGGRLREPFLPKRRPTIRDYKLEEYLRVAENLRKDELLLTICQDDPEAWSHKIDLLQESLNNLAKEQGEMDTQRVAESELSEEKKAELEKKVLRSFQDQRKFARIFTRAGEPNDTEPDILHKRVVTHILDKAMFIDGWHVGSGANEVFGAQLASWEDCFACHNLTENATHLRTVRSEAGLLKAVRSAIELVMESDEDVVVLLPNEYRIWDILLQGGGSPQTPGDPKDRAKVFGRFSGATVYAWPHWEPDCVLVAGRASVAWYEPDPPLDVTLEQTQEIKPARNLGQPSMPQVKLSLTYLSQMFIVDRKTVLRIRMSAKKLGYVIDEEAGLYHSVNCRKCPPSPKTWVVTIHQTRMRKGKSGKPLQPCKECNPLDNLDEYLFKWRRRKLQTKGNADLDDGNSAAHDT